MLTLGGILYDEGLKPILASCNFEELSFIRKDENEYTIETPMLTFKELHHLTPQLPAEKYTDLASDAIPNENLKKYAEVYRYFPSFMEIAT